MTTPSDARPARRLIDVPRPVADDPVDMHGPDSLTIRLAGDVRMGLMGGRTFVMQVAHPAVGAGVGEFSAFRSDPWKRLDEIALSGLRYLYRGEAAAFAEGRRLRRIHRGIQGVDARGRAYHALEPDVYGWVHTVFFDSIVTMHALFADPLDAEQTRRLFREWRKGGRIFGLRDDDMPGSVEEYGEMYAARIADTLEYNDVIGWILGLVDDTPPRPPSLARLPGVLWPPLWRGLRGVQKKLILATLPPAFREKIASRVPELAWTGRDRRRFERWRRWVRAGVSRLPPSRRYDPEAWAILQGREASEGRAPLS